MNFLFGSWLQSFKIFSPLRFRSFFIAACTRFYRVLKMVLGCFGFMLIVDALLLWFFGAALSKTLMAPQNVSLIALMVILLINVNWFVFSSAMMLFIRKRDAVELRTYFKQTFFAYLQLLLFWLFIVMFLLSFGITKFPHIPWIITACYGIIAHLTVFYWLDSKTRFKDILISLEKAANCFVYNLPVFVFLLLLLLGFDFGVKVLFWGFEQALNVDTVIFAEKIEPLVKIAPEHAVTFLKFLGLRYLIFFLKNLWVCFIFVFYDQKKGILYAKSCLDCLPEQQ